MASNIAEQFTEWNIIIHVTKTWKIMKFKNIQGLKSELKFQYKNLAKFF